MKPKEDSTVENSTVEPTGAASKAPEASVETGAGKTWNESQDQELRDAVAKDGFGNWDEKAARFSVPRNGTSLRLRWKDIAHQKPTAASTGTCTIGRLVLIADPAHPYSSSRLPAVQLACQTVVDYAASLSHEEAELLEKVITSDEIDECKRALAANAAEPAAAAAADADDDATDEEEDDEPFAEFLIVFTGVEGRPFSVDRTSYVRSCEPFIWTARTIEHLLSANKDEDVKYDSAAQQDVWRHFSKLYDERSPPRKTKKFNSEEDRWELGPLCRGGRGDDSRRLR